MRVTRALPYAALLLGLAASVPAQPWSGIIDPSRAIDWSTTNVGVGTIPPRTTICATLTSSATTSTINAAIAACPNGQTVLLSAGTYTITNGINFGKRSNVTLRGAGPLQTILKFTGADSCSGLSSDICIVNAIPLYDAHSWVQPGASNSATWSAGYAKGTTQITLTNVGSNAPTVGTMLMLDQANDTTDTGGVIQCDVVGLCSVNGGAFGRIINGVTHSQIQVVTVTAISGSTYTISPGLYANNWRASQGPGAWWSNNPVSLNGVEGMTLDHTAAVPTSGINFYNCSQCWVKNIRSIQSGRNHIGTTQSAHIEIRDSYFYASGGAEGIYGIEPSESSDGLIENNIFDQIAAPVMFSQGSGWVVAYNSGPNPVFTPNPAWMQVAYASHDAGSHMNLFEENFFAGVSSDDQHGGSPWITTFRNWYPGQLTAPNTRTGGTWAFELEPGSRVWNIVGNVLGFPGYHVQYETSPTSGGSSNCARSIFALGWANNPGCSASGSPGNDPLVESTMLRWGNYDTVSGTARWNASEIPTTAVPFVNANSVPTSHKLPNSFYQPAKPGFLGSTPWPAIGPDVTGGTGPGGLAYTIPAQTCFTSSGRDSSGVLLFDANTCYTQTTQQAPPPVAPATIGNTVR